MSPHANALLRWRSRLTPTVRPPGAEVITLNCDNGHFFGAWMAPVPGQTLWIFLNRRQAWCPFCGLAQSEEAEIVPAGKWGV